jgi:hypothetical protein
METVDTLLHFASEWRGEREALVKFTWTFNVQMSLSFLYEQPDSLFSLGSLEVWEII